MTDGDGKPPGQVDSFLSEEDLADIEDIFDAYVSERPASKPAGRATPQAPRPNVSTEPLERPRGGPSRTVHGLQGFSLDDPRASVQAATREEKDSASGTHLTSSGARPAAAQSVATGKFSVPTAGSGQSLPTSSSTQSTGVRRNLMASAPGVAEEDDEPFQQRIPTGMNRSASSGTISGTGIHRELDKALAEQSEVSRKQASDDDWDADVSSFSRSVTGPGAQGGSAVLRRPTRQSESPRTVTARTSASHPAAAPGEARKPGSTNRPNPATTPGPTTRPNPATMAGPGTRPGPAFPHDQRRSGGPGSTLMFGESDVDALVAARDASAAETSPIGKDSAADTAPVGAPRASTSQADGDVAATGELAGRSPGFSLQDDGPDGDLSVTPDDLRGKSLSSSIQAEFDALGDDDESAFDAALSVDGRIDDTSGDPFSGNLHAESELVIDESDGDSASTEEELGHPAESTRVATFDEDLGVLSPDALPHAGEDEQGLDADSQDEDGDGMTGRTALIAGNSAELDAFLDPSEEDLAALSEGPSLDLAEIERESEQGASRSAGQPDSPQAGRRRPQPRNVSPTLDLETHAPSGPRAARRDTTTVRPDSRELQKGGSAASPLGPLLVMIVQAAIVGGALYWLGFFAH